MGTPDKVGPTGDPGFPRMKGKTGRRGELRVCARLIISLRKGSGVIIPSEVTAHQAKKAWMLETARSRSSSGQVGNISASISYQD